MLIPGETFSSYRVIREIGRGAMGAVFEAEHVQLRKRVAIKVLLPEAANDRAAVQRFLREGEAAARIRHEHIVDVSDVGTRDGTPYLVMEYLDGESLADRLARKRRFTDTELVDLAIPICDALAVAHESGVIHRDVKPDNIFLARTKRGATRVMLVDFGISHFAHNDPKLARLTSSAVLIGTPCYLSPEAARSARNVDARSDQYSFGATLYECRTGLLPYERPSIFEMISAILLEDPVPPSERASDIDPRLDTAILRAMSRHPENRFPDMRALALALLPLASPAVRAHWEPEFLDPARGGTKRTPLGAFDAPRTRPVTTADDLRPLDPYEDLGLARTDPPDGFAPVAADVGVDDTLRPEVPTPQPESLTVVPRARGSLGARPWVVGVTLAVGLAVTVAVLARGAQPAPVPIVAAVAVARPTLRPTPVAWVHTAALPSPPSLPLPPVAAPYEHPRHVHHHRDPAGPDPSPTLAVAVTAPPPAAPLSTPPPPLPPPPRSLLRTDFGTPTP